MIAEYINRAKSTINVLTEEAVVDACEDMWTETVKFLATYPLDLSYALEPEQVTVKPVATGDGGCDVLISLDPVFARTDFETLDGIIDALPPAQRSSHSITPSELQATVHRERYLTLRGGDSACIEQRIHLHAPLPEEYIDILTRIGVIRYETATYAPEPRLVAACHI